MKHYLNFKPTIIYRKGSSFLLKTSLIILYLIPVAIFTFMGMKYFDARDIANTLETSKKLLAEKNQTFHETIKKLIPDTEMLKKDKKILLAYSKISRAYSMSWSNLLSDLEKLTPATIRFNRVRIRPGKIVKVIISGDARTVGDMTSFIHALFLSKAFSTPYLKHQTLVINKEKEKIIRFSLEVGYLPQGGTLL